MTNPTPAFATFLRRVGAYVEDVARTTGTTSPDVAHKIAENREANGLNVVSPFDPAAPVATQRRQITAHNALLDRATPGTDRICGVEEEPVSSSALSQEAGPCILKEGHRSPRFSDAYPHHMDAEQAARAERYLVHSNPDKTRRA